MGIFRNITKSLKKAAPLIGSAIGMYFGGPLGASIGSGIGSLAAGRSAEEALKNAALTGATTYAMGGKDFGKGFKFDTSGSPLRTMFQGADTSVSSEAIKKAGGDSFLSKLIPESTMGKVALAGGIGALASGLGEEEQKYSDFKYSDFPEGQMRAGMGMVDGISFNLNDDEERAEYFRRVREKQGFKDKEDKEDEDELRTFSRGGLNALGAQIASQVTQPIQGKMDQIGPFLDEVKTSAEQKFGVTLNGQGGGMGMNQLGDGLLTGRPATVGGGMGMNQLGGGLIGGINQIGASLPTQNTSSLFDQMQNRFGNQTQQPLTKDFSLVRPAYMPMDEDGNGVDQFGAPMEVNPYEGLTQEQGAKILSDAFNQGVSGGSGPFGAGTARLGGIGAIGSLFMNNGGEVTGPGTGTSDSVPARLSDGEFVVTARAVRGAGGGDRDLGAARMYDMMSQLERIA